MSAITWIVVADSAHAGILKRISTGELRELEALDHPQSRLHQGDLRTGGEGAVTDRAGHGVRGTDSSVTTGERHTSMFAGEIARYLSEARHQGLFDDLTLVAEPALLGALRKQLDPPTTHRVQRSVDKNWVSKSPEELVDLLKQAR